MDQHVRAERRAAAERLVGRLAGSDDPVIALKARVLGGLDPTSDEAAALRERIPAAPMAVALRRVLDQDAKTLRHAYRKWQGPHWSLVSFALIDHPPGDDRLRPLASREHDWVFSRHFLEPPMTAVVAGQEDRVRHCASMDGNLLWSVVRLGLEEDRTAQVAERLIGWQWPDGGWNCDRRAGAAASSFQESLIPARGLRAFGLAHDNGPALAAAGRVADLVLARRLLWRQRDGALIDPAWGGKPDRIHFPFPFFDVLFALQVMAELGRIADPRCADALTLLESKWLPDGGFPVDAPNATSSDSVVSRGTYADWGPAGTRRSNPLVSLAALEVLRAAEQAGATA